MAINMNRTFVGITTKLTEFAERKNYRRSPDVRISYENTEGKQVVETICPYGARVLSKALAEMADLADPPKKRR